MSVKITINGWTDTERSTHINQEEQNQVDEMENVDQFLQDKEAAFSSLDCLDDDNDTIISNPSQLSIASKNIQKTPTQSTCNDRHYCHINSHLIVGQQKTIESKGTSNNNFGLGGCNTLKSNY